VGVAQLGDGRYGDHVRGDLHGQPGGFPRLDQVGGRGVEAAARHYFRTDARALSTSQAAQLAVMLPAPKRFEKRPGSAYVVGRAGTIAARMGGVEVP